MRITPLLALLLLCTSSLSRAEEPSAPELDLEQRVAGEILIQQRDLDALRTRLQRSIFRATASQLPPRRYAQRPLVYDGAIAVVEVDGAIAFLSSASWLTGAERVTLIDGDEAIPLVIERIDHRVDLALLRLEEDTGLTQRFTPLPLARAIPMNAYALLSPQTRYESLAAVAIIERVEIPDPEVNPRLPEPGAKRKPLSFYWRTSLAAGNGYPIVNHAGHLVALSARRDPVEPATRGHAIGLDHLVPFVEDDGGE